MHLYRYFVQIQEQERVFSNTDTDTDELLKLISDDIFVSAV